MSALVCVARIGAAHGVRGAVKLWTFTEDPFAVRRYGPLLSKDGKRQFEVATAREAKDHLVATFKGVTTRDEAERLNGIELYVAREKLPATDDDEYYHTDLIGLAAVTTEGDALGRVLAIHNFRRRRHHRDRSTQGHDDAAAVHERSGAGGRSQRRPRRDRAAAGDRGR
ncbi:16S rRNA processing protein RimM [Bradyrhizobium ottawaense]